MDIVLSTYANGTTFIDKGSEIPVWASNTTTANSWALPNVVYGISKNGPDIYIFNMVRMSMVGHQFVIGITKLIY